MFTRDQKLMAPALEMISLALAPELVTISPTGAAMRSAKRLRRGASAAPVVRIQRQRQPRKPVTSSDFAAIRAAHEKRERKAALRRLHAMAGGWGADARQAALG